MLPVIAVGAIVVASYAARAAEKLYFYNPNGDNSTAAKLDAMVKPGFLDGVLGEIVELCSGPLVGNTSSYAFSLFKSMIFFDFFIAIIMGLIAFESGPNFITVFINKIFKYGFWTWILMHWREIAAYITGSLEKVGAFSSDVPKDLMLHPGLMLSIGYDLSTSYLAFIAEFRMQDIFAGLGFIWLVRALVGLIAAVTIFCAFGLLALNIFLTTLEYYICMSLMLIFIPFAVFDKTERFASQAFSLLISAGTRMMVATALVSIIYSFFSKSAGMSGNGFNKIFLFKDEPSVTMAMIAVVFVFIMVYLCCELPAIASSVINGSLNLTSNNAIMHAAGAAMIAGKAGTAVANTTATVAGAVQRGADAYRAASNANSATVAAGGSVNAMAPIGTALKNFSAGIGAGITESTFGGMEEAKRVSSAASGRHTGLESVDENGNPTSSQARVTRDREGNVINPKGNDGGSKNSGANKGNPGAGGGVKGTDTSSNASSNMGNFTRPDLPKSNK